MGPDVRSIGENLNMAESRLVGVSGAFENATVGPEVSTRKNQPAPGSLISPSAGSRERTSNRYAPSARPENETPLAAHVDHSASAAHVDRRHSNVALGTDVEYVNEALEPFWAAAGCESSSTWGPAVETMLKARDAGDRSARPLSLMPTTWKT